MFSSFLKQLEEHLRRAGSSSYTYWFGEPERDYAFVRGMDRIRRHRPASNAC